MVVVMDANAGRRAALAALWDGWDEPIEMLVD